MLLYRDYSILETNCLFCKQKSHTIGECPSIFYQPHRSIIILRHLYSPEQQRSKLKFKRRDRARGQNALVLFDKLNKAIDLLRNNNLINLDSFSDYQSPDTLLASGEFERSDGFPSVEPSHSENEETPLKITRVPKLPTANFLSSPSIENLNLEENSHPEAIVQAEKKEMLSGGDKLLFSFEKVDQNIFSKKTRKINDFYQDNKLLLDATEEIVPLKSAKKEGHDPQQVFFDIPKHNDFDDKIKLTSLENLDFQFNIDRKKMTVNRQSSPKHTILKGRTLTSQDERVLFRIGETSTDNSRAIREFQTKKYDLFNREYDSMCIFSDYNPHNNANVVTMKLERNFKKKAKANSKSRAGISPKGKRKGGLGFSEVSNIIR